jgi:hypothetical protein
MAPPMTNRPVGLMSVSYLFGKDSIFAQDWVNDARNDFAVSRLATL